MASRISTVNSGKGFSLIEVTISIAILAILALLILGGVRRATEESKAAKCTSQLRSASILIHNYASDNQGMLPWYVRNQGVNGFWWYRVWRHSGLPAYEFSRAFTCPSHEEPRRYSLNAATEFIFTYRYNAKLGYITAGTPDTVIYPVKNFRAAAMPSAVPLLGDSYTTPDNASGMQSWQDIWAAHGNGTFGNVVMLDGHVARIRKTTSNANVPGTFNWDASPNF